MCLSSNQSKECPTEWYYIVRYHEGEQEKFTLPKTFGKTVEKIKDLKGKDLTIRKKDQSHSDFLKSLEACPASDPTVLSLYFEQSIAISEEEYKKFGISFQKQTCISKILNRLRCKLSQGRSHKSK